MYSLILTFPFLGFCIASGFGRFLGSKGAGIITTSCLIATTFLCYLVFYEVGLCGSPCFVRIAPWFESELFDASWGFLFDSLTAVMLIVITSVSSLVHLYSLSYMEADNHLPRFMSYLSLFTFCMIMLVTGDNFVQIFFGWEGVGLASYLLINFWFTRLKANKSAIQAMLMNRVGDVGLALGIFSLFALYKTTNLQTIFACASISSSSSESISFFGVECDALTLICCLLFIGAVGKSAQLGLHTWLPMAMEGPSPVSALIHAATMVTAGVFLIARCSPLFEYSPNALCVVSFVGAMTAFFAATTGVVQNDLKRVVAYSTCSQLGYMIFACGLSHYSVGVFHLMNHACFKALLFLSAGSVIHALSDEQDMRKMGGLVRLLPFTYSMMLIGSLALIGFPFLTGFYSKDVILEVAYSKYSITGNFAYWLGITSAFCTAYYSFRLIFMTFFGKTNSYKSNLSHVHEAPIAMALPLIVLSIASIFVGYTCKDMMIGIGTDFWGTALYILPENIYYVESEYIPQSVKMIPFVFSGIGAFISYYLNIFEFRSGFGSIFGFGNFWIGSNLPNEFISIQNIQNIYLKLYTFLNQRWLFDKVYNDWIGMKSLKFGYEVSFQSMDKGILELFGPTGLMYFIPVCAERIRNLQSGYIYHYTFTVFIFLTLSVVYLSSDQLSYLNNSYIDIRLYALLFIVLLYFNPVLNRFIVAKH